MYLCKTPANTLGVRWEVKEQIILKTKAGMGERAQSYTEITWRDYFLNAYDKVPKGSDLLCSRLKSFLTALQGWE